MFACLWKLWQYLMCNPTAPVSLAVCTMPHYPSKLFDPTVLWNQSCIIIHNWHKKVLINVFHPAIFESFNPYYQTKHVSQPFQKVVWKILFWVPKQKQPRKSTRRDWILILSRPSGWMPSSSGLFAISLTTSRSKNPCLQSFTK